MKKESRTGQGLERPTGGVAVQAPEAGANAPRERWGLRMEPLLMCDRYACHWAEAVRFGVTNLPDADGGPLTCPECGSSVVLASYGVVNDAPTAHDLDTYGLRRASGTWWR